MYPCFRGLVLNVVLDVFLPLIGVWLQGQRRQLGETALPLMNSSSSNPPKRPVDTAPLPVNKASHQLRLRALTDNQPLFVAAPPLLPAAAPDLFLPAFRTRMTSAFPLETSSLTRLSNAPLAELFLFAQFSGPHFRLQPITHNRRWSWGPWRFFSVFSRPCTTKRAIFWVTVKSFGKSVREGRPRLCVADGKAQVKVKVLPFRTNKSQSPANGDHSALGTKTTDRLREIKELLLDAFVLTQVRIMGWKMCLSGSELEVGLKVISALQNWEKPKQNIKMNTIPGEKSGFESK